jgi:hypothetical protein
MGELLQLLDLPYHEIGKRWMGRGEPRAPSSRRQNNISHKEISRPPSLSCATRSVMRRKIPCGARVSPRCICSSAMPYSPPARRAARERQGNEADYLPVLADALVRQQKFADLLELVQPGDRDPVLESKLRTALGTAAAGLGDRAKAETLLGEAIRLDTNAEARLNSGADRSVAALSRRLLESWPRSHHFARPLQIFEALKTAVTSADRIFGESAYRQEPRALPGTCSAGN